MGFTIFRPDELAFEPRGDDDPRSVARLSEALSASRANVWRYPAGTRGRRHRDLGQEEVFVVLDGTLTVDLGDPPERHEVLGQSLRSHRPSATCLPRLMRTSPTFERTASIRARTANGSSVLLPTAIAARNAAIYFPFSLDIGSARTPTVGRTKANRSFALRRSSSQKRAR